MAPFAARHKRAHAPWWLLAGAVLSLALAACAPPPPDLSLATVQRAGTLRVGLDASFPPLESTAADGTFQGIDPSLARAVARQLGVSVTFVAMASDGLHGALVAGAVDAVISSFIPVREWSRQLGYSQPYYDAGPVLAGTTATAETGEIGVEAGGDGEAPARSRWAGRLRTFDTSRAAVAALVAGQVQAVVVDVPDLRLFAADAPGLHALTPVLASVPYVVAVRGPHSKLLAAIDAALTTLRASGELAAITAPGPAPGPTPAP
ncbi:MAG TPA: ABC transporter substrate-binding protein [Chloroflexota bacterium]|nr:ABC transporter substrate-binding protein [Chloroflexota bacterium]